VAEAFYIARCYIIVDKLRQSVYLRHRHVHDCHLGEGGLSVAEDDDDLWAHLTTASDKGGSFSL
jgi:hypothetical protein